MKKLVALPIPILVLALQTIPSVQAAETPRQSVAQAMILRPNDPWPRGKGHVVLAAPGSREEFPIAGHDGAA